MLKRVRVAGATAALLFCLVFFGAVAAAEGFSADVVSYYGKETMQGRIFVAKDKMRFESAGTISITRLDKQVVWLLMPSEKMYMEQAIRLQNLVPTSEPLPGELERTLIGSETVNGYPANKYRIAIRLDHQKQSYLEWLAVDSGWPLRMAAEDGRWIQEYRNLKSGDPDVRLFEIPAGYQRFGMGD
ncbi:MAG: DUF4412 domain-containing protein [Negativicutes bacterium]|nr:DUF4412 domain-containing protein [Negativicutes bacterium]